MYGTILGPEDVVCRVLQGVGINTMYGTILEPEDMGCRVLLVSI